MLTASWSSWTPGRPGSDYRGVIDDITDKGTHRSGDRVWRCAHHHPTESSATQCATAELSRRHPRTFSQAQLYALAAMADARPADDQSWIRANTLRSLTGLWWEQHGTKFLTPEGHAAFESAGGYDKTWGIERPTVEKDQ